MPAVLLAQRPEDATAVSSLPEFPLLAAKLAPPQLGLAPLQRPRLLDLLSVGVAGTPVTLLSGPAGSGKTVLAGAWMRQRGNGRTVGWLTLDEADDDPAAFWPYLTAALARAGIELPEPTRLFSADRSPMTFAASLAASLSAQPRRVVLILDNADRLAGRPVLDALDLLIRHGGLRVILCARADPPLPLHRYRVAGLLTEIRAGQLAFTAEETRDLLAGSGAPVPADFVAALHAATEGWAVALRLARASFERGATSEQLLASLVAPHGGVAQYVAAEVLDQQPTRARRFLLRISVTEQLWPELVDRLTGEPAAGRVLASLAAANAFIDRATDTAGDYRVHPLFRRLLAAQLAYYDPGAFVAGHRTCATWYAQAGDGPRATEHAIAAGDWQLAAGLLVDGGTVGRLLTQGAGPGPRVPAAVSGADAAVVRAAAALADEAAPDPADLVVAATAAGDPDSRPPLQAAAAVVCAAVSADTVPAEPVRAAGESAEALVAALPDERRRECGELATVLTVARATALLRTDAADDTILDALHASLRASSAADAPRLRARSTADLALSEALQGRLCRAAELTGRHQTLCAEHRLPVGRHAVVAATAAAWVGVERHQLLEARRWLARAQKVATGAEVTGPLLAVVTSRLRRANSDVAAAAHALHGVLDAPSSPRWVREQVVSEAVRIGCAPDGRRADVQPLERLPATSHRGALLRAAAGGSGPTAAPAPLPATVGGRPSPGLAVEVAVLQARQRVQAGDTAAAVVALEQALHLAEPEQLRRPFLDAPGPVRKMLRVHPRLVASAGWLNPTVQTVPPPRRPVDAPGSPPVDGAAASPGLGRLSEREMEVLQHLAAMLSTPEIAATMFLSVNTVRSHVRAILRKLVASRRSEAVRRARELQII